VCPYQWCRSRSSSNNSNAHTLRTKQGIRAKCWWRVFPARGDGVFPEVPSQWVHISADWPDYSAPLSTWSEGWLSFILQTRKNVKIIQIGCTSDAELDWSLVKVASWIRRLSGHSTVIRHKGGSWHRQWETVSSHSRRVLWGLWRIWWLDRHLAPVAATCQCYELCDFVDYLTTLLVTSRVEYVY
jgi:hypothetical protein